MEEMISLERKIAEDYWSDFLSNIDTNNRLIRAVRGKRSYRTVSQQIPEDGLAAVISMCMNNPLAEATVFLSIYSVLLQRYQYEDGVLIAIRCSFSQNDIFMKLDGINSLTLKELLSVTKEQLANGLRYADYSSERLRDMVSTSGIDWDGLFKNTLAFGVDHKDEEGIATDLLLNIDRDRGIIELKYDTAVLDNEFSEKFLSTYTRLLCGIRGNLDTKCCDIKGFVYVDDIMPLPFNNTIETDIMTLFEQQVQLTPDRIAVHFENTTLTYGELNNKSNALARYLINSCNVTNGDTVGILMNRDESIIIAILGILKAGCCYLPLEINPAERLRHILDDARPKVLVTISDFLADLTGHETQLLCMDIQLDLEAAPIPNLGIPCPRDLPAYLIYTSGTTGKPKGAKIQRQSIINLVNGLRDIVYIKYKTPLQVALIAPLVFDPSVQQIFASLLQGHTLHIVPNEIKRDGGKLWKYFVKNRIEISDGTPHHLTLLSAAAWSTDEKTCLKHLLIGGDMLTKKKIDDFRATARSFGVEHVGVTNVYGVTECCVDSSFYQVPQIINADVIPIGKAMKNCGLLLLNKDLTKVPWGGIGEIAITGDGLATAYVNLPELTDQKFKSIEIDGQLLRLYLTGDLGKWDRERNLIVLGRKDTQIKLRGFRVELDEIRKVLLSIANIQDAVIHARKDASGDVQDILAYFTSNGDVPGEKELKILLTDKLASYVIPARIIKIDTIPLTLNGKVDLKALPDPDEIRAVISEYVPPMNDLQTKVQKIWERVLEMEGIGIYDNFFEIGGHSLKAIQVVSAVIAELNYQPTVADVFANATIESFSAFLFNSEILPATAIPVLPEQEYYMVSYAQRRLWISDTLEEKSSEYIISESYKISGTFELSIFEDAVDKLLQRHKILRTSFHLVDGEVLQRVEPFDTLNNGVKYIDLSDDYSADENFEDMAKADARVPFALSKAPLFRITIVKTDIDTHKLCFSIHHIITDGTSNNILLNDLMNFYDASLRKKPSILKPLVVHYNDYAKWSNGRADQSRPANQKFWAEKLVDFKYLDLPYDYSNATENLSEDCLSFETELSSALTDDIRSISRNCKTSEFVVLYTLLSVALSKICDQPDVLIGTAVSNRNHRDLEPQIGLFLSTLPIRLCIEESDNLITLLEKASKVMSEAFAHENYSLDWMLKDIQIERSSGRHPLFNTLIQMVVPQEPLNEKYSLPFEIESIPSFTESAQFDLSVYFADNKDHFFVSFRYSTKLFEHGTIQNLSAELVSAAVRLVSNPYLRLTAVSS